MTINRRNFIKLLLAAPAIKAIDTVSSNKPIGESKYPKALLVDPFQVNMKDLTAPHWIYRPKDWPKEGIKIVRVRRPFWGRGEPIKKIF